MAKIKLGQRPKSFKHKVSFRMLDGTTGVIEVEYKYRTRSEFAAFIDKVRAAAAARAEAKDEGEKESTVAEVMAQTAEHNADYILDIVQSWNLDEPLNVENVKQLCDEMPGAAQAIIDAYGPAVNEGRLGN